MTRPYDKTKTELKDKLIQAACTEREHAEIKRAVGGRESLSAYVLRAVLEKVRKSS